MSNSFEGRSDDRGRRDNDRSGNRNSRGGYSRGGDRSRGFSAGNRDRDDRRGDRREGQGRGYRGNDRFSDRRDGDERSGGRGGYGSGERRYRDDRGGDRWSRNDDRRGNGRRNFDRDGRGGRNFESRDGGRRSFNRDDRGNQGYDRRAEGRGYDRDRVTDDRGGRGYQGRREFNRDDRGERRYQGERRFERNDRGGRRDWNRDGDQRRDGERRSFNRDDRGYQGRREFNRDERGGRRFDGERRFERADRGNWGRDDQRRGDRRPFNREDRGGFSGRGERSGRDEWRGQRNDDRRSGPREGGFERRGGDDRRGQWRDHGNRDDFRGDRRGFDDRGHYDSRGGRGGRDGYDRRRDEEERQLPPGLAPAENEPELPEGYDESQLPAGVRAELKGVSKFAAEKIGGHLQAAGELIDIDPELALRHVMVARRLGSRLPVVREVAGEVAYAADAFDTALTEYRALHRMTGNDDYLPVIADCERAVGKHQNALRTLRDAKAAKLSPAQRIEAVLVEAGIREDLGQRQEASRLLKQAIGANQGGQAEQARLRVAYANLLAENGQTEQAIEWLTSARKHDRGDELGIDELLAELRGEIIEPESDEFEILDVEEYREELADEDGDILPEEVGVHGEDEQDEASGSAAEATPATPETDEQQVAEGASEPDSDSHEEAAGQDCDE